MPKAKVFVAEFIGTFALVFIGAAAALYGSTMGLLGIALAHGLTLAVFVYVFGRISGTHINPAVTLGFAANGNITWSEAVLYWIAQFAGGALAALWLHILVPALSTSLSTKAFAAAATTGLLTGSHPLFAMAVEALLTFFLVNTILHTVVDGKPNPFAGWAIGMTLTIAILAGWAMTGASLNPARSFGPALFTSSITAGKPDYLNTTLYLIYFMGPAIGAVLAALLYRFFKAGSTSGNEVEDVEVVEIVEETIRERPAPKPMPKPAPRKARRK